MTTTVEGGNSQIELSTEMNTIIELTTSTNIDLFPVPMTTIIIAYAIVTASDVVMLRDLDEKKGEGVHSMAVTNTYDVCKATISPTKAIISMRTPEDEIVTAAEISMKGEDEFRVMITDSTP